MTMTTNRTARDLIGNTWHLLNNTKYAGVWTIETATIEGEWILITEGRMSRYTRLEDCFATEAEAKAEGKARRQPRRAKVAPALYGDFACLAAFSGIATDGSGIVARSGRKA